MGSTEYWPRPLRSDAEIDDRFERLRKTFYHRLCGDRGRLSMLRRDLDRANTNAAAVYEEIRMLAHRVSGAAALFEYVTVLGCASTLEQAALEAIRSHSARDEPRVCNAMSSLIDLLPTVSGDILPTI